MVILITIVHVIVCVFLGRDRAAAKLARRLTWLALSAACADRRQCSGRPRLGDGIIEGHHHRCGIVYGDVADVVDSFHALRQSRPSDLPESGPSDSAEGRRSCAVRHCTHHGDSHHQWQTGRAADRQCSDCPGAATGSTEKVVLKFPPAGVAELADALA